MKGYDKAAHPVQILPKKIIKVNQPVISIALTVGILLFIFSGRMLSFNRTQRWLVYSVTNKLNVSGTTDTTGSSTPLFSSFSPSSYPYNTPSFPTQAFPSEIQPYRPPQAVKDAHISKITSCDDVFAALSSNGEVFTFSVPNFGSTMESLSGSVPLSFEGRVGGGAPFKPQRVWALRKKFSAVKVSFFRMTFSIAHELT